MMKRVENFGERLLSLYNKCVAHRLIGLSTPGDDCHLPQGLDPVFERRVCAEE